MSNKLNRISIPKWFIGVLGVLIITGLLAGCGLLPSAEPEEESAVMAQELPPVRSEAVMAEGNLVPRVDVSLSFQTAGQVAEIFVEEGDQVEAGDVLARLGDREPVEAQLATAELELLNAQQALDDLYDTAGQSRGQTWQQVVEARRAVITTGRELDDIDTDDYQDEIDDARVEVTDREEDLKDAQEDFDKYKNLDEENSVRKQYETDLEDAQKAYNEAVRNLDELESDLEAARADYDTAQANLEKAQRDYEARQDGPDPDDVALAEARVRNAEAQVTAAQAALDNLEITAPFAGTVVDVDITLNEQVIPNRTVIEMADFSAWYVETDDLTEIEVVNVSEGQTVTITPDALPDAEIGGSVVSISQNSELKRGDVTYTARIRVDDFDLPLRWGMTVTVTFEE